MSWKNSEAKEEAYKLLLLQQKALLEGETDLIANLANSSALLNQTLQETVFAGYYLYKNDELILGPFQGNVSCVHIPMGKGVCGESAEKNQTLIVENVLEHKNYIACDSAARSEIVVPMKKGDQLIGVLDLDSSEIGIYDQVDRFYLEQYVSLLLENMVINRD
ncbi:GAF domain-containing protein [Enterococcus pseudoavium]|uniref:GAF domain-containing protein n=1 Tax=Enterococcus pseudoavium TaxID=44007 RepID=A0AAE4I0X1_9ENTE|nr:GAF domain-containing protein [Enterococcus pseudoavium]MDT2736928.1 GAF domain-containing protein [Enterococcus pseudoavium]MDT2755211.1 GAF domain-containing protein [Enterococcus pseudoavium]MDT2769839.1 GAF domain-containing protein [Enterococcus pseudoavium]REC31954.1 GAF domain-containing protein [Enterococcus pseudoavium]